jgi:acyl carrier protein
MQRVASHLVTIREIVAKHGRLSVAPGSFTDDCDLYGIGLTSLATVSVMLALEDEFDIAFPEAMLKRKTFESLESIAEAVASLVK